MLNDDMAEFLIIGNRQQLSKVSIQSIKIGQTEVSPVVSARNLGTWFDTHLDMGAHIIKTYSSAFYYLYNIRHISKYLSRESTATTMVVCWKDHVRKLRKYWETELSR